LAISLVAELLLIELTFLHSIDDRRVWSPACLSTAR
jgi:hypothetical protein